LFFSIINKSLF